MMNTLTKSTYLCLLRQRNSLGCQVSKMSLYRLFRCLGTRLYSTEAWIKSSSCKLLPASNPQLVQAQCFSTADVNMEEGLKERLKKKMLNLVKGDPMTSKHALRFNAIRMYLSCTSALIYNDIHKHVDLPNSFGTWHKLVSLHIWMLLTRLVQEDKSGKKCRDFLIKAFHEDVQQKVSDIGNKLEVRVNQDDVDALNQQFVAALHAYDEGLLMSDRHLAGALWRTLFMQNVDVNPCDLEILVHYIRKNVKLVHGLNREHILANGMIPFLPIQGDSVKPETYNMLTNISQARLKAK